MDKCASQRTQTLFISDRFTWRHSKQRVCIWSLINYTELRCNLYKTRSEWRTGKVRKYRWNLVGKYQTKRRLRTYLSRFGGGWGWQNRTLLLAITARLKNKCQRTVPMEQKLGLSWVSKIFPPVFREHGGSLSCLHGNRYWYCSLFSAT